MNTVEDCIEILAGMQERNGDFNIERSDFNLITSLARQTFRGIGFTDRQHELAKQKVEYYREQYEANGYAIDIALEETRLEIRKIDRSRWIRLVDHQGPDRVYESDKAPFIAVRFIFQKKLISSIDAIKRSLGDGDYDKENKIHYFPFSEKAVYEILSNFNETNNFIVDEELTDYYRKLDYMKNNKENFIPGIYNLTLKNLHQKGVDYAISSLGEPSIDNLCYYWDQKEKFGLAHFDDDHLKESLKNLTSLSYKIVNRTKNQVLVNNKKYTKENLVESILELYRFPLIVILNESTCYDELVTYYNAFNGIIPNESCSVLFRLDNNAEGIEFNNFIRRKNLNNPLDNNTKIVYISNNKLPKPLLKSSWTPTAAITNYSGKTYGSAMLEAYLSGLDLVIHYDSELSPWKAKQIEII